MDFNCQSCQAVNHVDADAMTSDDWYVQCIVCGAGHSAQMAQDTADKPSAAPSRVLLAPELPVIEAVLRHLIGHWHAVACDAALRRAERERDMANQQYEYWCLAYERITGKAPFADGDKTVGAAFADMGVVHVPPQQLLIPEWDGQQSLL